jgi:hypothetical protein
MGAIFTQYSAIKLLIEKFVAQITHMLSIFGVVSLIVFLYFFLDLITVFSHKINFL